jgi:hypothetical protein
MAFPDERHRFLKMLEGDADGRLPIERNLPAEQFIQDNP